MWKEHWGLLQEALGLWQREEQDCVILDTQGGRHYTHRILLSLLCPVLSSLASLPHTQTVCVSMPAPHTVISAFLEMLRGKAVTTSDREVLTQVTELARSLGMLTHTWTIAPMDTGEEPGIEDCGEVMEDVWEPILEAVLDVDGAGEEPSTGTHSLQHSHTDITGNREETSTHEVSIFEATAHETSTGEAATNEAAVSKDSVDEGRPVEDRGEEDFEVFDESGVDETFSEILNNRTSTEAENIIDKAMDQDNAGQYETNEEGTDDVFENILEVVEDMDAIEIIEEDPRTEPNRSDLMSKAYTVGPKDVSETGTKPRLCRCVEVKLPVRGKTTEGGTKTTGGAWKTTRGAGKTIRGAGKTTGSARPLLCLKCGRQRRRGLQVRNREEQEVVTGVMGKWKGPRFPCNQCMYVACRAANLENHKLSKHKGVLFMDSYITEYFSKNKLIFI